MCSHSLTFVNISELILSRLISKKDEHKNQLAIEILGLAHKSLLQSFFIFAEFFSFPHIVFEVDSKLKSFS